MRASISTLPISTGQFMLVDRSTNEQLIDGSLDEIKRFLDAAEDMGKVMSFISSIRMVMRYIDQETQTETNNPAVGAAGL